MNWPTADVATNVAKRLAAASALSGKFEIPQAEIISGLDDRLPD